MSTGLPRPDLARSEYRGRIKLLRGYVSKYSASLTCLNSLTITQLACSCERYCTRSRTALHGPAHQLAVHRCIIISITMVRGPIRYGTMTWYSATRKFFFTTVLHLLRLRLVLHFSAFHNYTVLLVLALLDQRFCPFFKSCNVV